MKSIILPLLLFPLFAYSQYRADCFSLDLTGNSSQIKTEDTFDRDTILPLNIRSAVTGLSVSGICVLNNDDDSYVRVILVDEYNYEYLIYENYPLLSDGLTTEFTNTALETVSLSGITPQYLKIELQNATVRLASVNYTIASSEREEESKNPVIIQKEQAQYIVDKLNASLKRKNMTWRAGLTSISEMSYSEKKDMFGGHTPELYGVEYYAGGIFVVPGSLNSSAGMDVNRSNQFVSEWDWRNRHGRNWMTPVRDQGNCGSCWAHAALGALEAYINLYYNRLLDYNLSEEELISCSNNGCGGGTGQNAYDYIMASGIVREECFPYEGYEKNCSIECSPPYEKIYIEGYGNYTKTEACMKQQLFRAPITVGINVWEHLMVMAGYKTINAGDAVYDGDSWSFDSIVIDPVLHADLIGKTAWLVKNSKGNNWGNNGYGYFVMDVSSITSNCYIQGGITSLCLTEDSIACKDADGDGLYFWGIGPKPAHCPSWAPDIPDGDDSNINYGSLDDYGNLDVLPPGLTISTIVTYSSNNSTSYRLGIVSGGELIITGTTTLTGASKIRVCEGGMLTIDGGILQNADIEMVPGSQFVIRNNGVVSMASGKTFRVPKGVEVYIGSGKIN